MKYIRSQNKNEVKILKKEEEENEEEKGRINVILKKFGGTYQKQYSETKQKIILIKKKKNKGKNWYNIAKMKERSRQIILKKEKNDEELERKNWSNIEKKKDKNQYENNERLQTNEHWRTHLVVKD